MIKFVEDINVTKENKEKYIDGINNLIEKRQQELAKNRAEYIKDIFNDAEKYRNDLKICLDGHNTTQKGKLRFSERKYVAVKS